MRYKRRMRNAPQKLKELDRRYVGTFKVQNKPKQQ